MNTYIRKTGFFISDMLSGGRVHQHLRNIRDLHDSADRLEHYRAEKLKELFPHATSSTVHYVPYAGATKLSDFPVLPQADLRYNLSDFMTCKRDLLQGTVQASTSGSYGMPMIYSFDRDKYARRQAEVIHFNALAGFQLGMRYARIHTSLKALQSTSAALAKRQNLFDLYVPGIADEHLRAACIRLAADKAEVLLGWPSLISGLVRSANSHQLSLPRLRTVISYGEVLSGDDRLLIGEAFGCQVFDRYACTELGVVAHDLPGGPHLGVNEASYVVELLDQYSDFPAPPGARGRIVVTDLHSKAIPLIRYDTGDTALVADAGPCAHISSIEGRYNEVIFDTAGTPMLSLHLYSALDWSQKKLLKQFQIVQTAEAMYELVIVPKEKIDADALMASMKSVLGTDADVVVRMVESIEPLPSGKRAVVVNRMNSHGSPNDQPTAGGS